MTRSIYRGKGTGLPEFRVFRTARTPVGTAGVQGVGTSWNPGVAATNTGLPSLYLAPISSTTLPTGAAGSKPHPGSFIVLSDGTLHYSNGRGQWVALTGPSSFAQGVARLLASPIRILDTRPVNPAAIDKGVPLPAERHTDSRSPGSRSGRVDSFRSGRGHRKRHRREPAAAGYLTLFPPARRDPQPPRSTTGRDRSSPTVSPSSFRVPE